MKHVINFFFKQTSSRFRIMMIAAAIGLGLAGLPIPQLCLDSKANVNQNRKVTGTVVSMEDNEPIIGASVIVEGATKGVITDVNGKFSIDVPPNATKLNISYIGMVSKTIPIKQNMVVMLESSAETLDELMVVAYGTAKKSAFTGSAAVVNSEKIEAVPVTSVTKALAGTVAGITVSGGNGMPGSSPTIYVRGMGSFSAGAEPLYVVDGMPYDSSISNLNPADIESITILKDAASTALYGSRAANGVVVITTKTGKNTQGKAKVNIKLNQGFTARMANDYKMMGTTDFLETFWEAYRNNNLGSYSMEEANQMATDNLMTQMGYNPFNVPDNEVVLTNGKLNPNAQLLWADDMDWWDAVSQLGNRTDVSASINGGNDKTKYFGSVGVTNEKGYIKSSEFTRYTARANVESQVVKWLKLGTNVAANMSLSKGGQNETSGSLGNPFRFAHDVAPIYPIHVHNPATGEYIYDEDGSKIFDLGAGYTFGDVEINSRPYLSGYNPALNVTERTDDFRRNNVNVKAFAEFGFLNGFKLTFNAGVGANSYLSTKGTVARDVLNTLGTASKTNSFTTTWTFNQLLTYAKDFNKHSVDVLVGHESYDYEYNYLYANMKEAKFDDNYELVNFTSPDDNPTSYTNRYKTEGFLSRLNYDYDERYYVSASFRRDGTSRFYKDSRWGNFWSVGAGWRMDHETWMKGVTWVDMLKLRLSYGQTGNDDTDGYYPWRAVYTAKNNGKEGGYYLGSLGNKDLKWESSTSYDLALEYVLLDNRLRGSIEVFHRGSDNLLWSVSISESTGHATQTVNAGSMWNRGVEFDMTGVVFRKKDFLLELNLNATHYKNKITYMPEDPYTTGIRRREVGYSYYDLYLRQWMGVDPDTGNSLYLMDDVYMDTSESKVEKDGVVYTTNVNEAKRDWSGNTLAKVYGGFGTKLRYKNFDMTTTFYYQFGGKLYDYGYYTYMSISSNFTNVHQDLMNHWREPGDITSVPRLSYSTSDTSNLNAATSTRWLVANNLLQLSSIDMGYTFPKKWISHWGISSLRLSASAENVFIITARKGVYPRRTPMSGYSTNEDVYVQGRTFTMGLNVAF